MNTQNIFRVLALVPILSLMISCSDMLDEPLENEFLVEGTDYTQSGNMILMLYGAYSQFYSMQWETHPIIGVRGDDVNSAGDQFPLQETDMYRYDRNFWMYNSVWLNLYSDLLFWHGAIEEIKKYEEAGANSANAQQFIAEIKVLQGFELLQLARLWGGILIPNQSQPSHLFDVPVSTFDEVMEYISNSMDEAIPLLPSVRPNQRSDVRGGVTQATALAVKAMANLELKNYAGVVEATDQIISSNLFTLNNDFYQLFKIPGKLDNENLLEAQYSDFGQASGTNISFNFSPYGPASWTPAVSGAGQGWGFWEPSQKYIKFMLSRNEQVRLETSVLFTPDGIAAIQEDPDFAELPEWISNTTRDGDRFNNHPRYLFLSGKFYLPSVQLTPGRFGYGTNNNFQVIRYAEILLMHAEALVNGASSGVMSAAEAVNTIRQRAGLSPLSSVDLDVVLDEKFAEFGTEWGIRFADLVRHGKYEELNYEGRNFEPSRHRYLLYPLEQQDIIPQIREAANQRGE
ncbi:RagB/SusD family nutrient uptake outer membrane protein [Mongoliibacter ruber]|uniref:Putative outer membrane starch-binding protein n=1 Tax=Mongoliibacter ruber TaxID=1750599 RepID=A0A2T0WGH1_9BACT|nr:RagB/SusD family nutrient uptake outer membrane protein [Mongoliibacter ruber]PRY85765.1 putative outer membrane starch-binding protein [Mongoliibacter ruber]